MTWLDVIHPSWREILKSQIPFIRLLENSLAESDISPRDDLVLRAFSHPLEDTKVVIFGQDPYPNISRACGLAFSVPPLAERIPQSLKNIFQELHQDIGGKKRRDGDLTDWVNQGVALINRVLTVPAGESGGHRDIGWQRVTDSAAKALGERGCIAILWGNYAREMENFFPSDLRISSAHPSPLSAHRGFFGSKPFSRANQLLASQGKQAIDWLGTRNRSN